MISVDLPKGYTHEKLEANSPIDSVYRSYKEIRFSGLRDTIAKSMMNSIRLARVLGVRTTLNSVFAVQKSSVNPCPIVP